jgi:hypothetical protein
MAVFVFTNTYPEEARPDGGRPANPPAAAIALGFFTITAVAAATAAAMEYPGLALSLSVLASIAAANLWHIARRG